MVIAHEAVKKEVPGANGQFKRIHFRFPPQAVEQLDRLRAEIGATSYVEVLKIALGLLDWTMEHIQKGGNIAAIYDGKEQERVVLPGISQRRR